MAAAPFLAAPVAENVSASVSGNTSGNQIPVAYTGATPTSASIVSGPSNGSASVLNATTLVYTPNNGWVGADSFTYRLNDAGGASNVATVSLKVLYPSGYVFLFQKTAGSFDEVSNIYWPAQATVEAWGAGGGSGAATFSKESGESPGGGGGGGEYAKWHISVTAGSTAVSGDAGAGSPASTDSTVAASNGGSTTVDGLGTLLGGGGGSHTSAGAGSGTQNPGAVIDNSGAPGGQTNFADGGAAGDGGTSPGGGGDGGAGADGGVRITAGWV